MRPPFLIPSLSIFYLLTINQIISLLAEPQSLPEAVAEQRANVDRRGVEQWPAARAPEPEVALNELVNRNSDNEIIARQNYYAFSGAIYIVGANGQSLSGLNAASPAYCPNQAPQSCGNIGVWNWCCPTGNTCAWADAAETYVGCCPSGYTCQQGSVQENAVQTVTVYITTTQYQQQTGVTTIVAPVTTNQVVTTTQGGGIVVVGTTTAPVTYNGFCTTIYAKGGNLPTSAAVPCGVALVVNDAVRPVAGQVFGMIVAFWCLFFASFGSLHLRRIH